MRRLITAFAILALLTTGGLAIYFAQGRLNLPLAVLASIAVLVAILFAWQALWGSSQRLKRLVEAAEKITGRELKHRVDIIRSDEIGELEQAFNKMAAQLEKTLHLISEQRNEMAAVLSNMTDGVLITNAEGRVMLINPAAERILQLPRNRVIGVSFTQAVRDYELVEVLKECLQSQSQRVKLVELGPQKQFVQVIATPLKGGEVTGALVALQDLTELRRLQTTRREFISNVSHEMRTPLASLKALVETLQEGAIDDPIAAKVFLGKAADEVEKLTQLVQEFSELSRIETGQAPMKIAPLSLKPLLHRVGERFQLPASRSGLELAVEVPADLPQVLADEERVEQVVVNLLHNAIKFTPPGGRVVLSARREGDFAAISLQDTGVGIAGEDLPHIFERFYKADKARSGGGTGMGLAIAKHIVQAHSGEIRAESTEGQGSTFTFTLPIAPLPSNPNLTPL